MRTLPANGEPPEPPLLFTRVHYDIAFRRPCSNTLTFGASDLRFASKPEANRTRKIIFGVNDVDNSLIRSCLDMSLLSQPMLLSVKSRSEENFGVLELSGPLTLSPALSSLREAARKLLGRPDILGLILHVSNVTLADSAGLGELTIVYSFASQRSCPLRLVGATPNLLKMLERTRLEDMFQPVDSVVIAKKQMRQ